jgi:NNP family nitrate/nitrite transporter-like MFS transporter
MNLREFRKAGHLPTLFCAFLYFDISFMVWVLLGSLAPSIAPGLGLSESKRGFMVAVPVLGGAALRLVLGLMTDRLGARRTAIIGMVLTTIPLLLGWLWADSFGEILLVGLMLGVAGASFAAALPLASRWYPPQHQGLAMGIAGAGNSGTALATLFAPQLAHKFGWHSVFGLALIPILATLAIFIFLAKDSPNQPAPQPIKKYVSVLAMRDTWWFCFFYSVTFGGFVGLAVYLPTYFTGQFSLTPIRAGMFATACVFAGSALRPIGGYLSDRIGGLQVLTLLYVGVGTMMAGIATGPALALATTLMFLAMGMLGLANGAVFQLVPQRFSKEVGMVTGIVGAAGGLGGFFLPTLLGSVKQLTGSFGGGFLTFGLIAFTASVAVVFVGQRWVQMFLGRGGKAAITAAIPTAVASATPTLEIESVGSQAL